MLRLPPLGPNEVAAARELLARENLVFSDRIYYSASPLTLRQLLLFVFVVVCLLAIEFLLLLVTSVPPSAPADNLADRWVIVTFANVKAENLS